MDQKNILYVKNLKKIYSNKQTENTNALNDLNLDVKQGEIFGLLGPNGAGKTTFINILAGTVIKTAGEVNVYGFDLDKNPRQVRASIGIVPQEINLDPFFSPRKLLELQSGLYGIEKKNRITDAMEIHNYENISEVHMKLIEVLHTDDLFYDIGYGDHSNKEEKLKDKAITSWSLES